MAKEIPHQTSVAPGIPRDLCLHVCSSAQAPYLRKISTFCTHTTLWTAFWDNNFVICYQLGNFLAWGDMSLGNEVAQRGL